MSTPNSVIITRPVTRTIVLSTGARGRKGESGVDNYTEVRALTGYPGESTGGNGSADSGKLVKFGTSGQLTTTFVCSIKNPEGTHQMSFAPETSGGSSLMLVSVISGPLTNAIAGFAFPNFSSSSDSWTWTLPAKGGTVAMTSDINAATVLAAIQAMDASQKTAVKSALGIS